MYPNPARDEVTIVYTSTSSVQNGSVNGLKESTISLYDLSGRMIANIIVRDAYSMTEVVDTSSYPAGVYIVVVKNADGTILMQEKLIIE